jgi:2-amino-4-hydroxy-6-hydroxymethyldihydropteridine diphosphokinase
MDVVIGLGSNLGDRAAHLRAATHRIAELGRVVAESPVYETRPVGGPPQGDYYNAALRLDTATEPRSLLEALLGIERALGRHRVERWAPRTIDLDVLWIRDRSIDEPGLEVPHPRLAERAFALLPLIDVAPDARDPITGVPYSELARTVESGGVRRLAGALAVV